LVTAQSRAKILLAISQKFMPSLWHSTRTEGDVNAVDATYSVPWREIGLLYLSAVDPKLTAACGAISAFPPDFSLTPL
jgi:hypothetical protein